MAEQEFIAGRKKAGNSNFFNNKLFIFGISLLCALIIWSVVSMYETQEKERVFQDVKVQMTLTDTTPGTKGMTMFGGSEFYCDVTVKGKSYLVNDTLFTSDKIIIKPELEDIREPGVYDVHLKAQLVNAASDLSIVSVSPEYVTVYFDTTAEKEFPLLNNISADYETAAGCTVVSAEINRKTVTLVGPSLEMSTIKEVRASVEFEDTVSKTIQLPCKIDMFADGKVIEYATVKENEKDIHLDMRVVMEKTYTMTVEFINRPADLAVTYEFDYDETIDLVVPTEDENLMNTDSICVATVDFSRLRLLREQELTLAITEDALFTEILPDTLAVIFYMETDGWTEMTYTVNVEPLGEEFNNLTIPVSIAEVRVVLPAAEAEAFAAAQMRARLDEEALRGLTSGENTVYASIILPKGSRNAWVYGTYPVSVTLNAGETESPSDTGIA